LETGLRALLAELRQHTSPGGKQSEPIRNFLYIQALAVVSRTSVNSSLLFRRKMHIFAIDIAKDALFLLRQVSHDIRYLCSHFNLVADHTCPRTVVTVPRLLLERLFAHACNCIAHLANDSRSWRRYPRETPEGRLELEGSVMQYTSSKGHLLEAGALSLLKGWWL
jgi:hypothetical protein